MNPVESNLYAMLPNKHVGSFLLLMFISIFNPRAIWLDFPISLEPISVTMIGIILLYKIYVTIGFKRFFDIYKVEVALFSAYFFVCFISLYFNRWRYQDTQEFIRYGVTFIVITASFPAVLFMFSLPHNNRGFSLTDYLFEKRIRVDLIPILIVLAIALLGIVQVIFPKLYLLINPFFIASDVKLVSVIRSVFRISTDFASMCAIIGSFLMICGLVSFKRLSAKAVFMVISCALICLLAGMLTGKRIFALTIILAFTISACLFYKNRPKSLIMNFIIIAAIFHGVIILGPQVLSDRVGAVFPYINFLTNYELPPLNSFVINFQHGTLHARTTLWTSALNMFAQSPLVGVSNGGFRLAHSYVSQNTHNVILQILIDGGAIGASIIVSIISYFIIRAKDKALAVSAVVFLFCILLVDNFIDHSVPWIIIVGYFSVWFWRFCSKFAAQGIKS